MKRNLFVNEARDQYSFPWNFGTNVSNWTGTHEFLCIYTDIRIFQRFDIAYASAVGSRLNYFFIYYSFARSGIKWKTKQKCNLIFLVKYSTSNVYFVCSNTFFVYCWLVCCPNPPNPNVSFQIVWLNLITVARLFLKNSRVLNSQK